MASKGIQNWSQSEKLTNRLKTLLEGYADGFSVPKEMIQNADDAGASCVRFMYDERENLNFQNDLLYPSLKDCMGPAFWVYNDRVFSEEDLVNIISLSSSYKQDDSSKVGKFGHGFCSVYNLTDIPSFVTQHNVIIFDPHSKYLERGSEGKRINLNELDEEETNGVRNLLKPFEGVFGFNTMMNENQFKPYNGTLFRLPLRTLPSEICSKPYTKHEIQGLFDIFIRDAGNLLLFTQHVKSIELFHLPADVQDPSQAKLIFRVSSSIDKIIQNVPNLLPLKSSVLSYMSAEMTRVANGEQMDIEDTKLSLVQNIDVMVTSDARKICNVDKTSIKSKWLIAWASGTKASMKMAKECLLKGTLPLGSVAALLSDDGAYLKPDLLEKAPFGFYRDGHLFCFQPLPVQTPFQVHINGSFAVALDRQKLCCRNEDNKEKLQSQWNENLLSDAICTAYLLLLSSLKHLNFNPKADFHLLWPDLQSFSDKNDHHLLCLVKAFYNDITTQNIEVFKHGESWSSFDGCCFLDPVFQVGSSDRKLYHSALNAALQFSKQTDQTFTDLPTNLIHFIEVYGDHNETRSGIYSSDWFFEEIFFPNILSEYWHGLEEERDNLVCFALDNLDDLLVELIRSTPCISTEPHGNLRKPSDLIHPECPMKPLFSNEDERFIKRSNPILQYDIRLNRLDNIGMIKREVPHHLVIDRAHSIHKLSQICSGCAGLRCINFLKYLSHEYLEGRLVDEILKELEEIEFLPVLTQPEQWPFEWKSGQHDCEKPDSCLTHKQERNINFQCPKKLYFSRTMHLVCITQQMMDDRLLASNHIDDQLLSDLGVQGLDDDQVPVQTVVNQLLLLSKTVKETDHRDLLKTVCNDIYKCLNDRLTRNHRNKMAVMDGEDILTTELTELQHQPVLLICDRFISPEKVAFNLSEDCHPYLYGINDDSVCAYRTFLRTVGVKEHFTAEDFLRVLLEIQAESSGTQLEHNQLEHVLILSHMLTDALQKERLLLNSLYEGDKLFLPDENGVFYPIEMLCMKVYKDTESSKNIRYVHPRITTTQAQLLGIQSQELHELMEDTEKLAVDEERLPFGPRQEITTRIKSLLSGYPCDSGIFKELIQNADDAGATEIIFVKDFRQHRREKVFNDQWRSLQGPALCVYNDTEFTPADIKGIQKVGVGTKSEDPTKTGQFGVGFNSVYHLTDVPSFLTRGPSVDTGGTLCFFDPHCTFVPGATKEKPGMQYKNLEKWKSSYPDVFSCYDEQLLKETGTVFRFPLRDEAMASNSKLVSKAKKPVNEEKVTKMLSRFKNEIFDTLLFLKSVKKISIFDISDGSLREEYTVTAKIENDGQLLQKKFVADVMSMTQKMKKKNLDITSIDEKTVKYVISLKDTDGKLESWLIAQKTGFSSVNDDKIQVIQDAYRNDENIKLFPRGGVAVLLKAHLNNTMNVPRKEFRAFSFLPLPIKTGLPVHVNGHFALDHEARRNLWREDDEGYRTVWNRKIMKDVIAPAYVLAIQDVKQRFGFCNVDPMDIETATRAKREFHAIFPTIKYTTDDNWKELAIMVLDRIVRTKADVFICLHIKENTRNKAMVHVSCCPLADANHIYTNDEGGNGGVFNNLHRQMDHAREADVLTQICKDVGMRLLDTPMWVYDAMVKAGIKDIIAISPEVVLKFFLFNKREPGHDYGREKVTNTPLKSVRNVCAILDYCIQSEPFQHYVDGLPLCLASDFHLREFMLSDPIFCTPYSHLFPSSSHLFLHPELVTLFWRQLYQNLPVFRQLDTQALSDLLPLEMNFEHDTAISWDPNNQTIPNLKWMNYLWQCLYDILEPVIALTQTHMQKEKEHAFLQMTQPLSSMCLIPCTKKEQDNLKHYLLPLSKTEEILIVSTFTGNTKLSSALDKINLHRLDPFAIHHVMYTFLLTNIVAVFDRPQDVLKCLSLNQQGISDAALSNSDCCSILEYLSENLDEIVAKVTDDQEVIHQLRSLPLFTCVQGTRIRLQTDLDIFIVKEGILTMPSEGLEEWGDAVNARLLRYRLGQNAIYRLLELEIKSPYDIYSDVVFGTFDQIPVEHREEHLRYIRDRLVSDPFPSPYSEEQVKLISALQELDFITLENGETKKASEFYSPHNAVIEVMFHPQDFPPQPYCSREWLYFMELAGMKKEVTSELFIQFAKAVETEGKNGITEEILLKSNVLVQHLFNRSDILNETLLQKISDIDFIVPFTVSETFQNIHEQLNTTKLICFMGSVFPDYQEVTWTTCNILPYYAMPFNYGFRNPHDRDIVMEQLGILKKPDFQVMLQHVQNICDNLQEKCQENSENFDRSELFALMDTVYAYLQKNVIKNEIMKHRLRQKPVVFLPEQMRFITCDRIVIKLDEEYTLKPYLYAAPEEFGKYFRLFEVLGSTRKLCSDNYAKVLHYLHIDVGSDELEPNELKIVRTSVHQMFRLLSSVGEEMADDAITVDVLYLPNRERKLVDSSTLVYSDKQYLEQYLDQIENIHLFAGFPQLDIPFPIGSHLVSRLPARYRPRILSDIIQQEFDLENVEMIESDKAGLLDRFIRSMEFIQGVIRLIVDERQNHAPGASVGVNETEKESLISALQNIHFYEVVNLKVKLIYEEAEVGQENVQCRVNKTLQGEVLRWDFYFSVGEQEWLPIIQDSFTEMINNCLDDALGSNVKHVSKILHCLYHFEDVTEVLDRSDIVEYSLASTESVSFFPPTGTLIHPRWHHMLRNAFTSFEIGDYVAVLVCEEEARDDSDVSDPTETDVADPVYIHASVVEILPPDENVPNRLADVMRKYKLDVDENQLQVFSAYRIYKYHRGNTLSESRELEPAVNVPKVDEVDDSLLSDICEEIKQFLKSVWKLPEDEKRLIVKRLIREWHPDKNIGNERFTTQVYECIQKTLEKMKSDNEQDVDGDTMDGRHRQHGWQQQVNVVIGRERQHQQQYNQQPTGFNVRPEPVPNPANARRWYKQAGKDLAAAQKFMDIAGEVDGYNWICYKCHQVSNI